MKITVYTTTDCQFSKQEREYLTNHNLQYEEKNLETDKEFLTEMLAISNNFAGTPVTRIEKDDGTITVLKGFTQEEFDNVFGFNNNPSPTPEPTTKVEEPKTTETPPPTPEILKDPISQPEETNPQTETPSQPVSTNPVEPPTVSTTPPIDEKLGSVLDKLEEKTEEPKTPPTEVTTSPTETPQPNIDSTSQPTNTPSIPDFSAGDTNTTV